MTSSSCKKSWLDVNYNPSELTDSAATPDLILRPLLAGLDWSLNYGDFLYSWMGYWCKPQINVAGDEFSTYNNPSPFWITKPKMDASLMEKKAMRTNQTFYAAIAKIIQVIMWSRNVDMLNNLPYTEAFKENIRQPKYDDGEFIYEELMKELDLAITMIKEAQLDINIRITKADIMFYGDKLKWIKFANTLKLRLLVHQANRPERAAYISEEISKIINEGSGFLNSGEDAALNPGYTDQEVNAFFYWYSKYHPWGSPDQWSVASANIVALNFLKETNDPRIAFFYTPVEEELPPGAPEPFSQPGPLTFRGNRYGLSINESNYPYQGVTYVSHIGGTSGFNRVTPASTGILKGYDMDRWVLTSIESLFLQAEAIYRGWLPGDAEQAYLEAVKESFRWLNVGGNSEMPELSDAVFDDWYAEQVTTNNPNVSWQAAPDKYKLLMFQKYMAFNGIEPFEAYVDYRRNGRYPDIPPSVDPSRAADKIPIRSLYDAQEYQNNAENVKAQGEIDIFTSKIWWMP